MASLMNRLMSPVLLMRVLIIDIRARTDLSMDVSIPTQMSIGRQFTTGPPVYKRPMTVNTQSASMVSKMLFRWTGDAACGYENRRPHHHHNPNH
jgi:hypothetical protein